MRKKQKRTLFIGIGLLLVVLFGIFLYFGLIQQSIVGFTPISSQKNVYARSDSTTVATFDDYTMNIQVRDGFDWFKGCYGAPSTASYCNIVETGMDSNNCTTYTANSFLTACVGTDKHYSCYISNGGVCGRYVSQNIRFSTSGCYMQSTCDTTQTVQLGGGQFGRSSELGRSGCNWKVDISYKGQNIYTTPQSNLDQNFTRTGQSITLRDNLVNSNLSAKYVLYLGSSESTNGHCDYFTPNIHFLVSDSDMIVDVADLPPQVFANQDTFLNIKVTNNEGMDYFAVLKTKFNVITTLGAQEKVFEQNVTIKQGENEFQQRIPTDKVTDTITVQPTIDIYKLPTNFANINNCHPENKNCVDGLMVTQPFLIGTIEGNISTIRVNPAPLWIEKPSTGCPTGYEQSYENSTFCVRNDLADLSCMQLGCPVLNISNEQVAYECTSTGFCAQKIYVYGGCKQSSDCSNNATCDSESGNCVETKIYENLVTQLVGQPFPQPVYFNITCKEVGCATGYSCVEKDYDTGKQSVCVSEGKESFIYSNILLIVGVVVIVGLIIIIIYLSRKKR